jgi:beta-ribofuranosylaminobenzene 5'-phosphate synthase
MIEAEMGEAKLTGSVRIEAPARLHLGFLDLSASLGRRFGSIGLAIDRPSTVLTVKPADDYAATGPEQERALRLASRLGGVIAPDAAFHVDIERAIPAHAGLGSGTQLALAIGSAIATAAGKTMPPRKLGELVERGARSAIGMAAFETGGFIVDGGRGPDSDAPPVLVHVPFPEEWRILLIMDHREKGVHGEMETRAFTELPPFETGLAAHICHLVLMQLTPALVEADIETFGRALRQIQKIIGGYFAPAQGGAPWTSLRVGQLAEKMAAGGAHGVGQSSWGPTGFGFVPTDEAANRLYHSLVEDAKAEGLEILIVRGRNIGASVEKV